MDEEIVEQVEDVANPFAEMSETELDAAAALLQEEYAGLPEDAPIEVLRDLRDRFAWVATRRHELEALAMDREALASELAEMAVVAAAIDAETGEEETVVDEPINDTAPIEEDVAPEAVEASADTPVEENESELEPQIDAADGSQEPPAPDADQDQDPEGSEGDNEMSDPVTDAIVEQSAAEAEPAAVTAALQMTVTAAVNSASFERGSNVGPAEFGQLAEAALGANGSAVSATVIASLGGYEQFAGQIEMLSMSQGTYANSRMIRDAIARRRTNRTVTAALCDPLEIIREIPDCGVDNRPFRDVFTQLPMARGGFTYTPGIDVDAQIWTEADQAGVDPNDPDTWKNCSLIACSPSETVKAVEAVGCITFDDTTEWSNPELVAQAWNRSRVKMARASEVQLLRDFDAQALAAGGALSETALADYAMQAATKEALALALNAILYEVRETAEDYQIVLPYGLARLIAANESGQEHGGCVSETDVLNCIGDVTGSQAVSLLDASGQGPDVAPLALNPGNVSVLSAAASIRRIRLVPVSSMFVGVTGVEDYGVERSPELRRQNRAQMFAKEYFALGRPGCAIPAYIDIDALCVRGGRLGQVTPGC